METRQGRGWIKGGGDVRVGLLWYVATLALYGLLLYTFRDFQLFSTFYHILLLFPLLLVALNIEKLKNIGFRRPQHKIWIILLVIVLPLFGVFSQYFLHHRTMDFKIGYALILTVFVASVTEEIFFRGYLQEKLGKKIKKDHALIVAAVLFGLAHVPRLSIGLYDPSSFLLTFLLGYIFGFTYNETDSLAYPILLHALYNFGASLF